MPQEINFQDLSNTSLKDLIDCLLISFEGYFVQMPSDLEYWKTRFKGARVDIRFSYGAFANDKLIGFIINGIDHVERDFVAFNTGTGVIPEYRSQAIVDRIYQYAIPKLKEHGINLCALDVIQNNHRAIRVYERIGFQKTKKVKCFKANLSGFNEKVTISKVDFNQLNNDKNPYTKHFAWDNQNSAILASQEAYDTYQVFHENEIIGYFVINPTSAYVPQMESKEEQLPLLLSGVAQIKEDIRINNISEHRKERIAALLQHGFINSIDQYYMTMPI